MVYIYTQINRLYRGITCQLTHNYVSEIQFLYYMLGNYDVTTYYCNQRQYARNEPMGCPEF